MNAVQKRNYYRKFERMKIATAKAYVDTFFYSLRVQKAPVLKEVRKHGPLSALIYIDQMNSASLFTAYKKIYNNVSAPVAESEYARLNAIPEQKRFGYSIDWLATIADYLNDFMLDKVIRPMTARTQDRMRNILTQGIATGDSFDEIADKLEDTEVDRTRAMLIARTETNNAVNYGTNLAKSNYKFKVNKEWLATLDNRTRGNPKTGSKDHADHWDMNGQIVEDGMPFTDYRAQAQLMFPGDSTLGAPASTICNCRCQLLTIPLRDANGRLIPK